MEIVFAIAAKIAEYTVGPIGQWLCYSCHYKSNMENLKNQVTTLRYAKSRVERDVEVASNNGNEIHDDVKRWLKNVDGILRQLATKKLDGGEEEAESRNSNASCLNLKQRHQISREAKKMVGNIADLLINGKFDRVAHHPPLQNMAPERNEGYITLGSRMLVMKRIMETLGDANIKKIGVSGLAGVGKSTLMEEICRQVKEKRLFDEVALAKVTNSPDLCRIQGEIADMLNLQFKSNETKIGRADRLRMRIQGGKEKLVILDDIWKELNLNEIGIPSKGCKLILTSRNQRVLASHMGTEKNFELDILGEGEAWNLFEKMAGDTVKGNLVLRNEAIKVAKECAGLPIALVTVSRALKDQESLGIWKDALVQLRRPNPKHDTEIWSPVYSCIELSYRHLVGKEVQSLFLLCARQGYYISYRDLLRYGFGLCLFHGIVTLEEARNRLEILLSKLQDSCLLQKSPHDSGEFYMHDVVRHVATIIASNDHNMFVMRGDGEQKKWPDEDAPKRCEALSICGGNPIHKYHPNIREFPKLRYFHVQGNDHLLESPDIFFEGMDKLEVLSLTNMQLLSLFPLTNLRTLCLYECKLGDIHGIGELKTLVILSLARSHISNLPREIQLLTRLRLLDLTRCYKLKVIPPNVLSSLVNLEELYMQGIDVKWEVEGPNNEGKNASLAELKKLSHLTTLEIDIPNANNLPANLFPEKLERYEIWIGFRFSFLRQVAFSRALNLKLNLSFQMDVGIKMLLKRAEYVYLDEENSTKSVLYEVDREDFQQLKHLHIQNNRNIKHIPGLGTSAVVFPILETFVLKDMMSLEEICQGNLPLESFKNLKVLKVDNCEKLRFIFSSSIARGLSLLEELEITRCNNMGAIFVKEEEDGIEDQGDMMLFGRLQTLVLKYLPKLVGFLSTKDSFFADCRETNSEGNHDLQLPLLHHDQVSLPSLQTLHMAGLPKIKHVWSCVQEPKTVCTGLEQLKILEISNCGVEEIVAVEGGGEALAIRTLVFPQLSFTSLETLHISNMDSLEIIFGKLDGQNGEESQVLISTGSGTKESGATTHFVSTGNLPLESFKNLKVLKVDNCQKLRFIFSSSIARGLCLSLLEELNITRCNNMGAIFVKEEEDGIEDQGDMMLFGRLQTLVLGDLPKLVGFLSTKDSVMADCRETNSEGNHDLQSPLLHHDQLCFPSVRELHLEGLPKIKHVWSKEPQTMFRFQALQDIYVGKCEILTSLFPAWVLRCLEQLKKIMIEDCGVEEIVAVERGGGEAVERTLVFPRVITLNLINLKRLKCFYKRVHVSKWPMLKEVKIKRCEKVKIFASGFVSFEKAVEDQRQSEMSIKQPLFSVDEHSFPSLEALYISHCEGLFHVFPTAIVMRSLTDLQIEDCCSLEIIFGKLEGQNGKEPQVLISPASGTEESGATTHFVSTVSFPSLQRLHMHGLPKMKHVWSCDQEPKTDFRFQNLQIIYASCCKRLKCLFPISVIISCREQLQQVIIGDCGVEEIVAVEGGGEAVERTLVFPQVTELTFRDLPRLKWFYKGVHVSKWPMLKMITILRCKKVEIFASEVVSFEKAVKDQRQSEMSIKQSLFLIAEHSFPSLERLFISAMDSLEIIFGKLEGQNGKEPQVLISPASGTEESGATTHFVSTLSFPSLKKLYIASMDKLEIIWQDQVTATSIPNIQELIIFSCHKLLHVFQSNLHTTTLIQSLYISSCSSLETIFRNMEGQNGKESQVLIAPSSGTEESVAREDGIARHIKFPILTQLSLDGLPKLKWIFEGVHTNLESWPSLKELELGECGEQVNKMIWASKFASSSSSQENQLPTCIQQPMFVVEEGTFPNLEILSLNFSGRTKCPSKFSDFPDSSSLLTGLPNLLELDVYDGVWEEIFPYELIDREIRLRRLRLCHLRMLTHLWKEDNTQPCPLFHNLEYLHVLRCGKLKNIVPSSVSLRNLTGLEISHCHGLINLLTSSTAKTLVQLERMIVIDCKRITEIVAMDDGEANVAITFNKLTRLTLDGLPNLTHFCSGPYSFGFPSLTEVIVRCCPEMKTFCHGVLSTPKLTAVYDDNRWISNPNLYWEDDLNTTTRCLWEESNQYDTRLLFRERVENSEEDEDHP